MICSVSVKFCLRLVDKIISASLIYTRAARSERHHWTARCDATTSASARTKIPQRALRIAEYYLANSIPALESHCLPIFASTPMSSTSLATPSGARGHRDEVVIRTAGVSLKGTFAYEQVVESELAALCHPHSRAATSTQDSSRPNPPVHHPNPTHLALTSIDDYEGGDDDDYEGGETVLRTTFVRRVAVSGVPTHHPNTNTAQPSGTGGHKTLGYYFSIAASRIQLSPCMDLTPTFFQVRPSPNPVPYPNPNPKPTTSLPASYFTTF